MRFSRFFVDRPIFAAVLSLVIVMAGALALFRLPISEYPQVVPPTVVVRATYPGANPKVIAETVASPLEQQINGVEDMLYMFSQATSDGRMTLTVTFALGTDLDNAQVQVQNRVAQALPRLPSEVQRIGVVTEKSTPDFIMVVHLVSPDGRYDQLYLSNFATLRVKDELTRIAGVGSAQVFGAGEYSMRVWLDPDRLASRRLTTSDVIRAIREQNIQVAAGVLGAQPAPADTTFQLSVNTRGRLSTEDEFADIVVRATPDGQITRVRDVGRVELGANQYALRSLLDNKPAVAIGIFQRPGTNAIEASNQVRQTMDTLKQSFPDGVDYKIVYDPTIFVRNSIEAVVETLFEAILLVVIVVMVFLQTWRASIIPLVAVPVSLIGTFAVMLGMGFSLNTLSLFGLVLSIGIVVDDAIVVVENVERHIEHGLPPLEATRKAMEEVSGPIIAIALVLCAVFVPTAFVSGLTGQFYRQFALTIAISTVISAFNSLTLSPALASRLLKPRGAPRDVVQRVADRLFGWFFRGFNRFFGRASGAYTAGVGRVLRVAAVAIVLYVGLIGLTAAGFSRVPPGFVPTQDKEYLVAFAQLPDGSTLDRTDAVIRKMSDDRAQASGCPELGRLSRAVDQRLRQRLQRRHCVRRPEAVGRANQPGPDGWGDRAGAQRAVLRRDSGSDRRDLPAAVGAGAWTGRRLQALRRRPGGHRIRGPLRAAAERHGEGAEAAVAGRTVLELPGQRAADSGRRRSRAREELRRGADRRLRDAAGLSRLALRERLQSLRADLSGQRAGRVGVPSAARADPPSRDAQRERRDGAAGIAGDGVAQLRARSGDALQRLSGRRDQRRSRARIQLGAGAGRDRRRPAHGAAAGHDLRVDRAGVSGTARGQHDAASCSRSACCSSTSCSPRSTRAGRCR